MLYPTVSKLVVYFPRAVLLHSIVTGAQYQVVSQSGSFDHRQSISVQHFQCVRINRSDNCYFVSISLSFLASESKDRVYFDINKDLINNTSWQPHGNHRPAVNDHAHTKKLYSSNWKWLKIAINHQTTWNKMLMLTGTLRMYQCKARNFS